MFNGQVIGVREFHYQINRPVKVRYIVVDEPFLKELNNRFDFDPFTIESVPAGVFQEYKKVMRFRDTQIFDPAIKIALKKIQEGITELVMLRLLAGDDPYTLTEGTLDAIEGGW